MHASKRTLFFLSLTLAVALPLGQTHAQPPTGAVGARVYADVFQANCGATAAVFTIDGRSQQQASGSLVGSCGVGISRCTYSTTYFSVSAGTHQVCALTGGIVRCAQATVTPGQTTVVNINSPICGTGQAASPPAEQDEARSAPTR